MLKKVNLDELLDEPLELTIGGKAYLIETIPVEYALRLEALQEGASTENPMKVLREMLKPLGVPDDVLDKMDARKALAAAYLIGTHFTGLPEKVLNLSPSSAARRQASEMLGSRGRTPSPPTAASSEEQPSPS